MRESVMAFAHINDLTPGHLLDHFRKRPEGGNIQGRRFSPDLLDHPPGGFGNGLVNISAFIEGEGAVFSVVKDFRKSQMHLFLRSAAKDGGNLPRSPGVFPDREMEPAVAGKTPE